MERKLRDRNTIKKPIRYTPDTKQEELKDDIVADDDWENEKFLTNTKKEKDGYDSKNEEYVYDDFVLKDTDNISTYSSDSYESSISSRSDTSEESVCAKSLKSKTFNS